LQANAVYSGQLELEATMVGKLKKSMEDCIVKMSTKRGGETGRTYRYEPGNGTSYLIKIGDLSPSECEIFNAEEGSVLATVSTVGGNYVSYPLMPGGYLAASYVQEKFRLPTVDNKVITEFLGYLLNRPVG
jgi:restriction endonuclease S subunit